MPAAIDLTGAWAADDGATYYIRQFSDGSVAWAGLHNSGFHSGMEFTNVFRGHVAPDGKTLNGDWADVPRGESNNSGTLSLEIVLELGGLPPEWQLELRQKPDGTSGGFGGRVWRLGLRPMPIFPGPSIFVTVITDCPPNSPSGYSLKLPQRSERRSHRPSILSIAPLTTVDFVVAQRYSIVAPLAGNHLVPGVWTHWRRRQGLLSPRELVNMSDPQRRCVSSLLRLDDEAFVDV